MKTKVLLLSSLFLSFLYITPAFAQLQSPDEFLGYEIGDRWTPHHKVLDYVTHVAEESGYATIQKYGETYEHRDLVYLVITTPENHKNLEEIRLNNLRMTGLEGGETTSNKKAIVWLSYNVHGNETSSSEAAMKTLYELVQPRNYESKSWLENTVVIMDPMVNPDGRDRYVHWYKQIAGEEPDAKFVAREHHEPWPGGRSNHYLFDLNRDWAWQVQKETQQRFKIYKQWYPHIHVDYHEQGYNDPYYFAPAAEPFHQVITDWQREFQTTIGENHIKYFDEEGWFYFTKEQFDLFYPGYGDTWPTFHGAIGMTYEQAGGGRAGLKIHKEEGDTLTLKDRLLHHYTTGMSTVEIASENADRLIDEFQNYFTEARENPGGQYKTFVIKADNNPDKIYHLLSELDRNQITYGTAGEDRTVDGYDYSTGETERVSISENDIIVSAYQPQGNFVRVLFEPNPELSDSLTYDITAWEAHYRFGLEGYALENRINPEMKISADNFRSAEITGTENPYAYILEWNSLNDARFLADITKKGVKSRFSKVDFVIDGNSYKKGSLIITRNNNRQLGGSFDEIVVDAAEKYQRTIYGSPTGYVSSGSDIGSDNVEFIEKPQVALLIGEGTSSLNAGEIWHFFDQQIDYPATLIHTDHLMRADLNSFNVLILPSGYYTDVLTDQAIEKISSWTSNGGTLISFGQTNRILAGRDGFQLQRKVINEDAPTHEDNLQPYENRDRNRVSSNVPGSIFKVSVDNTHPLAYGYSDTYYSLKTGEDTFEYLDSGWNVGAVQSRDANMSGFAGYKAQQDLENTLSFGVQPHGSGQVVYFIDNPLYRGFWENGKLLIANAVFFVGK
ncbi:MAG: M14 family metallopeptidase [Balneolaceae bacterium]|nr:M14 family metallopeptidase [Balneolaceae bacterium]